MVELLGVIKGLAPVKVISFVDQYFVSKISFCSFRTSAKSFHFVLFHNILYTFFILQPTILDRLPQPYSGEIKGVAAATGINLGKLI